jgi:hypothetical protein
MCCVKVCVFASASGAGARVWMCVGRTTALTGPRCGCGDGGSEPLAPPPPPARRAAAAAAACSACACGGAQRRRCGGGGSLHRSASSARSRQRGGGRRGSGSGGMAAGGACAVCTLDFTMTWQDRRSSSNRALLSARYARVQAGSAARAAQQLLAQGSARHACVPLAIGVNTGCTRAACALSARRLSLQVCWRARTRARRVCTRCLSAAPRTHAHTLPGCATLACG